MINHLSRQEKNWTLVDHTRHRRQKDPCPQPGGASKWELVFAEVTLSKVKHVQSE